MKPRPNGFLAEDKIDQKGEIFDYIRELHEYLWRFVRLHCPGMGGSLTDIIDNVLDLMEGSWRVLGLTEIINEGDYAVYGSGHWEPMEPQWFGHKVGEFGYCYRMNLYPQVVRFMRKDVFEKQDDRSQNDLA